MKPELEAKWLDVDIEALRGQLSTLGAVRVYPERLMRRYTLDDPKGSMSAKGGWVRIRDEGDRITLSYKELKDRTLHGTHEVSVMVDDFERTRELIEDIGLVVKSYQETKREAWRIGSVEVTIDTWPWIPTFVELEAQTEAELKNAAAKLELDWSNAMHGSVETAYQHYFDVTEAEVDAWPRIIFERVPGGLEGKRRT